MITPGSMFRFILQSPTYYLKMIGAIPSPIIELVNL